MEAGEELALIGEEADVLLREAEEGEILPEIFEEVGGKD